MARSWENYVISTDHTDLTVEEYLKQILHCSGRRLQKLTRSKGLRLNGKPVFLQKKVQSGDRLQIAVAGDDSGAIIAEAGAVDILYEDEFLAVLNKPSGILVHPTGQTTSGTLVNFLAFRWRSLGLSPAVHPVHRLDRDTSGCLIVAKTASGQSRLEQQLKSGIIKRRYHALVQGHPNPATGTIDAPIGPHPRLANRRSVTATGDPALTHYATIESFSEHSLLELWLETGRTHQIRVHLAHREHPVLGDAMYGRRSPLMPRQALHAVAITFQRLSDGTCVTVEAPRPADFQRAYEALTAHITVVAKTD
ncbi:MAG TPA: RluA family pseudouridine synthase [Patescibacteria group bacterium]|nr:RluA family pseudouridine synthase [Patescibacteria group bacterium]